MAAFELTLAAFQRKPGLDVVWEAERRVGGILTWTGKRREGPRSIEWHSVEHCGREGGKVGGVGFEEDVEELWGG